jgi:phytoene synthase
MPIRSVELATPADHAACHASIRHGSRSFFAASRLLPPRVRRPALSLYAFCRLADDVIDRGSGPARVDGLRSRLELIYAGSPADDPADRALADAVARHDVPRELLDALLEGFEWDLERRRYKDLEELRAYAERVAGSVGLMMTCIMGIRTPVAAARASELGVAMQLTNIARDVGEDARAGRMYLPTDWLLEHGVDPDAWLRAPHFSAAIAAIVRRLLDSAETLYQRAGEGIALLPADCRLAIRTAGALYCEIGRQLRRAGCDSVSRRTVVPASRKALVLARVVAGPALPGGSSSRPRESRAQFVFDLFERLERRDRGSFDEVA